MKKNIFIIVIISISISITLFSTWFSYRNALRSSEDFLKAQALAIAASLENTIIKYGTDENIFSGIITGGKWQGIAFIALYDTTGLTILHSNQNLINKRIDRSLIRETADNGDILYSRSTLGTGETVFLLDFPVHSGKELMVLRIALHPYPSLGIVRQERLHLLSVLVIVLILGLITFYFLILSRKKQDLEKSLFEKEKLSVIGEMASVLAHEIRNPLGSIKGFAQYLKEQSAGSKPQDKELTETYLGIIVSESGRIERLTEDLLVYARQDDLMIEKIDLAGLINEVLSSLSVPESISIIREIPDRITISSDKNKLRQTLTNLLQNASDAIAETGEIGITAKDQGDSIMLAVSDNGTGIPDNEISKIFKPFFTTKTKGTGLGLAIVERYVKALGGEITVESASGKGSVFRIIIPDRG